MPTLSQLNSRREQLLSLSGNSSSTSSGGISDILNSRRSLIQQSTKSKPVVKKTNTTITTPTVQPIQTNQPLKVSKEPVIGKPLKIAKDILDQGKKIVDNKEVKSAAEVYKKLVSTAGDIAATLTGVKTIKTGVEKVAPVVSKTLRNVPELNLGTKGQKLFQATDAESKAINFISNFPSGVAKSLADDIDALYTKGGREKLKQDAKNLPKTMNEVKDLVEKRQWLQAYEKAMSNSAISVGLDVAGLIPGEFLPKFPKFLKARSEAQQIVKEAVQETATQAVEKAPKAIAKDIVKVSKNAIESYIEKPKNVREAANIKYAIENTSKIVKDYTGRVTEEYGTPNVITADEGKYVFPGYTGSKAPDYHEAGSGLAKYIYDKKLIERKGQGNNTVLFTAGGTGSGKTTALRKSGTDFKDYSIIYDTNLTGESAAGKIQKALDNGYKVEIKYVQRDPVKAFEEGVLPRVRTRNRIVTIDEHIARHKAINNVVALKEKFGDKISVDFIDNTGPAGSQKAVSFDNLKKFNYTDSSLRKTLNEKLDNAIQAGKITKEEGLAIRGTNEVSPQIRTGTQQKPQGEVIPKSEPITRTPTVGTPSLAEGVRRKAIKEKVIYGFDKTFKDLPEYDKVNVKEQGQKATELVLNNLNDAIDIAMGRKTPPNDVLPESVFIAVENFAHETKNVDLLRQLATQSDLTLQATGMGQRIRMLAERNPDSAVGAMQKVNDARVSALEKRLGKSVKDVVKAEADKIKAKVKVPDKYDWNSFVNSIAC